MYVGLHKNKIKSVDLNMLKSPGLSKFIIFMVLLLDFRFDDSGTRNYSRRHGHGSPEYIGKIVGMIGPGGGRFLYRWIL